MAYNFFVSAIIFLTSIFYLAFTQILVWTYFPMRHPDLNFGIGLFAYFIFYIFIMALMSVKCLRKIAFIIVFIVLASQIGDLFISGHPHPYRIMEMSIRLLTAMGLIIWLKEASKQSNGVAKFKTKLLGFKNKLLNRRVTKRQKIKILCKKTKKFQAIYVKIKIAKPA